MTKTTFKVHAPKFIEVAKTVTKGLNPKDTSSQTLLKIEDEKIELVSSSSKYYFKGHVDLVSKDGIDDENGWGIDGSQLKTIISILEPVDDSIEFTYSEKSSSFEVKLRGNKLKLPVYEKPSLEREEKLTKLGTLDGNEFNLNISHVSRLVSTDDVTSTTPIFYLNIIKKDDKVDFVGSNAISLLQVTQDIENSEDDFAVLLKPSEASLLITPHVPDNGVLDVYETKTKFGYVDSNGTLSLVARSNIAPMKYAGFHAIVSDEQQATISTKELKYAIDSLAKLSPTSLEMTFNFEKEKLIVENNNLDKIEIGVSTNEPIEDQITIHKQSLSLLYPVYGEKIRFNWTKDKTKNQRLIQVVTLDSDEKEIENVFIGISSRIK